MYRSNDPTIKCCCGSHFPTEDIYDDNGMFIVRVCRACKKRKLREIHQNKTAQITASCK